MTEVGLYIRTADPKDVGHPVHLNGFNGSKRFPVPLLFGRSTRLGSDPAEIRYVRGQIFDDLRTHFDIVVIVVHDLSSDLPTLATYCQWAPPAGVITLATQRIFQALGFPCRSNLYDAVSYFQRTASADFHNGTNDAKFALDLIMHLQAKVRRDAKLSAPTSFVPPRPGSYWVYDRAARDEFKQIQQMLKNTKQALSNISRPLRSRVQKPAHHVGHKVPVHVQAALQSQVAAAQQVVAGPGPAKTTSKVAPSFPAVNTGHIMRSLPAVNTGYVAPSLLVVSATNTDTASATDELNVTVEAEAVSLPAVNMRRITPSPPAVSKTNNRMASDTDGENITVEAEAVSLSAVKTGHITHSLPMVNTTHKDTALEDDEQNVTVKAEAVKLRPRVSVADVKTLYVHMA